MIKDLIIIELFFTQKNIKQPSIKIGPLVPQLIGYLEKQGLKPSYENEYTSDYHGKVKFKRYNLANLKTRKGNK